MKKVNLIGIALFAVFSFNAYGDNGSNVPLPPQPVNRTKSNQQSGRPSAPSNVRIYFSYDSENKQCVFTLRDEIEYMTVTMENENTGVVYYGEVDAVNPVWDVELPVGYYYISCVTDDDAEYAGEVAVW